MQNSFIEKVSFFLPNGGSVQYSSAEKDVRDIRVATDGTVTIAADEGYVEVKGLPYLITWRSKPYVDRDLLTKKTNDKKGIQEGGATR